MLIKVIGVDPGGWKYGSEIGPDAIISSMKGVVEIRRVGEENFVKTKQGADLFPGDVVRAGANGEATLLLVDLSFIQLTHDTVVAIGDRDSGADPASSAAVLYGVARFSVSKRGRGEGPFLVYTPSGVVGTVATTYVVGVAVDGHMRVGVEDGVVEVAATTTPETTVTVRSGRATNVQIGTGKVSAPTKFSADDWGEWRDTADADVNPTEVIRAHAAALARLQADTTKGLTELDGLARKTRAIGPAAASFANKGDAAGYAKAAPDYGTTIEASYLLSLRLEHLTYAQLAHAYLARELHLRHPKRTRVVYAPIRRRVAAAILFHKRYHAVVHRQVKPWRSLYYLHHPVGRRRIKIHAGVKALPKFYKKRPLRDLNPKHVLRHLRRAVYRPPRVTHVGNKRVWLKPRKRGWHEKLKLEPRSYRNGRWYRRAQKPRARVFVGVKAIGARVRVFGKTKRTKRGATVRWGFRYPGMGRRFSPRVRARIRAGRKGMKARIKARRRRDLRLFKRRKRRKR